MPEISTKKFGSPKTSVFRRDFQQNANCSQIYPYCPLFGGTPIISGTGKATNFAFGGYIHGVRPDKSPSNILEKRERGRIQGLTICWRLGVPLLSEERVKLQNSNFACTFTGSIETKVH